jgi:EPS-associated MarR family transcriptional regulator
MIDKLNEKNFIILRKLYSNPEISQRNLAKILGFSVGKLNYCLKALKNKGLIKIKNFSESRNKHKYSYLITPKGLSHKSKMAFYFMKQKMKEYEDLKKDLELNEKN